MSAAVVRRLYSPAELPPHPSRLIIHVVPPPPHRPLHCLEDRPSDHCAHNGGTYLFRTAAERDRVRAQRYRGLHAQGVPYIYLINQPCSNQSWQATAVTGFAGTFISAVQNTLTKQNVGAMGVITRSGGTIAIFCTLWARSWRDRFADR
jgi:hypothetical protein